MSPAPRARASRRGLGRGRAQGLAPRGTQSKQEPAESRKPNFSLISPRISAGGGADGGRGRAPLRAWLHSQQPVLVAAATAQVAASCARYVGQGWGGAGAPARGRPSRGQRCQLGLNPWMPPTDAGGAGRTARVLALQSCSRGRRAEKSSTAPEIAKFCPGLASWPSPLVASCWCVNEGALTSSGDGQRSGVLCSLLPEPSTIQQHSEQPGHGAHGHLHPCYPDTRT